jgi:energy-converting hydrogenase A subunit R
MEMPDWPEDTQHIADLPKNHQKTLGRLDRIFWQTIPEMKIGRVFEEVDPVGGVEKAKAVLKSLEETGHGLEDVMYVGDSITDVQALDLVRERGGLAVSFNGNGYAIRSAQVCCMSNDARVIAVLADVFNREGRDSALDLVQTWGLDSIHRLPIDTALLAWLNTMSEKDFPRVELISNLNRRGLIAASEVFRKSVRGERIGALG